MSLARVLFVTALALNLSASALPAAAEDGDEPTAALPPEALLIREVIAEFRLGLFALRDACGVGVGRGEELGAMTVDARRAFLDECQRGMRELRDLFHEAREAVLELKHALHEQEQEADEVAKEEQRAAEERAKEDHRLAEERAREAERRRAEEKAKEQQRLAAERTQLELAKKRASYEKQARDLEALIKYKAAEQVRLLLAGDEARAAELGRYVAQAVAQRNEILAALARLGPGPSLVVVDKRVTEVASKAAKYRDQLAQIEEKIAYKEGERDRYRDYARELREYAEGLEGDERERYLHKAYDADRQADEWEHAAEGYRAQREEVKAALDRLLAVAGSL